MKPDITQTQFSLEESTEKDHAQIEKDFLLILSELVDDEIWLDTVLNRHKVRHVDIDRAHSISTQTITDQLNKSVNDRVNNNINCNVETEIDLEETIMVAADLSLQSFPYQNSSQKD